VEGDALELAFRLPPGAYATALLGEVFELEMPGEAAA
jgi:tRNA(Glu) U13 pseudouridine synthase TruD